MNDIDMKSIFVGVLAYFSDKSTNRPLRAIRALSVFNYVLLRTRRELFRYKVYGNSALLVLNGSSVNSNSALLALN